jgi:hypothetical protein
VDGNKLNGIGIKYRIVIVPYKIMLSLVGEGVFSKWMESLQLAVKVERGITLKVACLLLRATMHCTDDPVRIGGHHYDAAYLLLRSTTQNG